MARITYITIKKLNHYLQKLNEIFSSHRNPDEIVTDNVPNLARIDIQYFSKMFKINHKICMYWTKANAGIERLNKTLGKALRTIDVFGQN